MTTLISQTNSFSSNDSTYTSFSGICEKKEVRVLVVHGKNNYVNILVKNAMQKAYKGMGKDFPTIEAALNNYKCSKIKAIISGIEHA